MTCEMPSTSMPRAAMSVAISTRTSPELEALERLRALALRAVRVQRRRLIPPLELARDASAPCLVRENTSTDSSAASFSRWISAGTLPAIDTSTTYCVTASAASSARRFPPSPGLQHFLRHFLDLLRHRRREEQRLARRRRGGDDAADRGEEAHVEHAIRFVEHEHLRPVKSTCAVASDRSGGPAWRRRDRRRGAAPGSAGLRRRRRRSSRSAAAGAAVGADVLFDLRDQLARRRDHEHAHGAKRRRLREPLEERQHERRRLAGAGLRDADD
jgi:hypothetical protein